MGDRVTVVTQQPPGAPAQETIDGVRVVRVAPDGPFPYHLPSLLTWVGLLDHRIGRAAQNETDIDIVHAHDWMVGRAASVVAGSHRVPLVATVHATEAGRHSGWLPDDVSRAVHLVERWLVDEADAVIVCSQAMAHEVVSAHRTLREKVTVIPNGIDVHDYHRALAVPPDLLRGGPRITFVGRLEWEKGVFTAVDAMPRVLIHYPDARLRFVGTGSQTAAMRAAVADADLRDHVELLGHVDEQTLRAVYTSTDLLIAPSSYEPFGIVALEAAAMQVPLIVGDTGGLAEFVTEQRGRRCRPGDPADLAQQILAALDDPAETRRRCQAATQALSHYTWAEVARRTDDVYRACRRRVSPPRAIGVPGNPVWRA
jgi:glycogen(starch) synthase